MRIAYENEIRTVHARTRTWLFAFLQIAAHLLVLLEIGESTRKTLRITG